MHRASFDYRVRVAAGAGALACAALAVGNGLDRLAKPWPSAAERLPALFADNALLVGGEAALSRDPQEALALARRTVARAPIEPASTALLGAARLANGDYAGADRAFRVAGRLGWRIPLTQAFLEQAALDAGDMPTAAIRLDALLRAEPQRLRDPATLAPFEDDPAARAAFAERLRTRPPWLAWYVGQAEPVPAGMLLRRWPTLMLLGDHGVVLGCATIAPAVRQLAAAGMTGPADALQRRHCGAVH